MDDDDWDADAKDENGLTALHHAARAGEAASGGLLVECGADTNVPDSEGNTPLHLAGRHNKRLVASMLLWGGAERNAQNNLGNTALHEAALKGSQDVAWLITENGGEASVLIRNNDGLTPLEIVRRGDNQELIDMLGKCATE